MGLVEAFPAFCSEHGIFGWVATAPIRRNVMRTFILSNGTIKDRSTSSALLSIQYLRAAASLLVVILHAGNRMEENIAEGVLSVIALGHVGVDLFFVISGFIIWTTCGKSNISSGQFLIRRTMRVVPIYWVATFAWVFLMFVGGASWISLNPSHIIKSLFFIPHWSPTFQGTFWPVLVPGWTLIFEMFFYGIFALTLFAPAYLRLYVFAGILILLIASGLVIAPTTAPAAIYSSPLLLEFLGGVLIAELLRRQRIHERISGISLLLGLTILGVAGGYAIPDQTSWSRPLILGSSSLLIVLGLIGLEGRLPYINILKRLGDASYSIYLFHVLVIVILYEITERVSLISENTPATGFILMSLLLSGWVGLLLHDWLERPIMVALGRTGDKSRS